jgi:iron-sulfur cluster assembly accessory protein
VIRGSRGQVEAPGYTCRVNEQGAATQTTTSFIQLTESAAGKVRDLLVEEGRSDIALRVAVQPGGCSGLRYSMYLDDQIGDQDVTDDQFGVRVVVDRMSAPYLSQATIDFVDTLEAAGFTIDNPMAQGTCACGHSFH